MGLPPSDTMTSSRSQWESDVLYSKQTKFFDFVSSGNTRTEDLKFIVYVYMYFT